MKYIIPELEIGDTDMIFCPNWGISMNDRLIGFRIAQEMLSKLAPSYNAAFTSQYDFSELKEYFSRSLMQLPVIVSISLIIFYVPFH